MSSQVGFIDIILLAMFAGFIILRLRNILGRKTGFQGKPMSRYFPKGMEVLKDIENNNEYIFNGYIEGNEIFNGDSNVIITDGFTGNVSLKTAEGLSQFMTSNFKNIFNKNLLNKLAYLILKKDLKIFNEKINPSNYNGAMVLGLNSVVVKSHGNASPVAFAQAIMNCLNILKEFLHLVLLCKNRAGFFSNQFF